MALQMNALPELGAAGFAHALTVTSLPPTGKAIKRIKTVEFADVGRKRLLSLASVIYMKFYKHTHTHAHFFSFLEQLESYCRLAGFMTLPFQPVSFCPIVVDTEFEHLIKVGSIRFFHCQAYLFLFEISKQSVE